MGKIRTQPEVKLIIGFIFKEEAVLSRTESVLRRHFGSIDFISQVIPFTYSEYYEKEMGRNLKREFISFKKLIPPQKIARIKNYTNAIEKKLSIGPNRQVNIDPGYIDQAKLVLATTKDFNHRIYLERGIFAEVTLFYQDKTYKPWAWTYPDYKTVEYASIFNQIRQIYLKQVNSP